MLVLLVCSDFFFIKNYNFFKTNILQTFSDKNWIIKKYRWYRMPVPRYFSRIVPVPAPTLLFSSKYRYCGTFRKYRAHLCTLVLLHATHKLIKLIKWNIQKKATYVLSPVAMCNRSKPQSRLTKSNVSSVQRRGAKLRGNISPPPPR